MAKCSAFTALETPSEGAVKTIIVAREAFAIFVVLGHLAKICKIRR